MDNDKDKEQNHNGKKPPKEIENLIKLTIEAEHSSRTMTLCMLCITFLVVGVWLGSFLERGVAVKCNPQTKTQTQTQTEKGNSNASYNSNIYPRF